MRNARVGSVVIALVGVLLLAAWGEAEAQLRPASAEVVRVAGRVESLAKGQTQWRAATVGARLVEGDQIRAFQNASADLNLPDGSTILVAENSRFAVTKLDYDAATRDRDAAFYVVAGKVRAQVSQAAVQLVRARATNFTISTPSGVAAVRGTIVVIVFNPATRETLIFALPSPGQLATAARVTFVSRTGQPVTIQGGQFTRVVGTGTPTAPGLISTMTPAGQAEVTAPTNATTVNAPELAAVVVTVFTSTQDITIVETATGLVVTTTTTTGETTTTTVSAVGQDVLTQAQAPAPTECVTSISQPTCP